MSDVVITVRGEHETRIEPEEAVVRLSVRAEGPERAPVVDQVATESATLRDELQGLAADGSVREWSAHRLSAWSDRPWNAEGRQLAPVHHATVAVSAVFTDFTALSQWATECAQRAGVVVEDVAWRLTPNTQRRIEADVAAEAVTTAVSRAEAYAKAIGRGSVAPLEIADVGLLSRPGGGSGGPGAERAMLRMAAADMGGATVVFEPDDIVVTAAVEARFAAR